jgi:hypothetical protein
VPVECQLTRRPIRPNISHSLSFWFIRRRFFYAVKLLCVVCLFVLFCLFSYGNVHSYLLFKFNFRIPLLLLFRTMLCYVLFSGPWVHTLVLWWYDHFTRGSKRHLQTLYKLRRTLAHLTLMFIYITRKSHIEYPHRLLPWCCPCASAQLSNTLSKRREEWTQNSKHELSSNPKGDDSQLNVLNTFQQERSPWKSLDEKLVVS